MSRFKFLAAILLLVPTMVAAQDPLSRRHPPPVRVARQYPAEIVPLPPVEFDYSLADLEQLAFQNNPTLATAAARIEVARGRRVQAGLFPNPVAGYHATEIGNLGTSGQQGGFISQRFITAGKLRLDGVIAGREVDEARFQFRAQELRVLSDVRVRFYDALVAQRRIDLTGDLANIGDRFVTATQTLLNGRLATENDLLQAEIKAEEALVLLDNARNQHIESWRRLAAVIGVATLPIAPLSANLESDLSQHNWEDCFARVLGGNPELHAAQARVQRANLLVRRANREPIPNVDVSVSVRHHNVTSDDVANVQLGIPLPIFNRNQGNIRAARAEWMAASSDFRRIELSLQDRLAIAFRRYVNARQQADRYRQRILPRAQLSLELVTKGYDKGQVRYLTLLTAQQTYLQVNLSYLDSMRELRSSAAIINGQLLSGSLTKNP